MNIQSVFNFFFCCSAKGTEEADSVSGVTEEKHPVLPTHISLEELHGHARVVASKVLSRPKSGVSFMADARAAVAMWADRLSSILGPLPKGKILILSPDNEICQMSKIKST